MLLQGTLAYLAPEVLDEWVAKSKGREPVPVKACTADMWSAGCLLLEALTGRNPFQVRRHMSSQETQPRSSNKIT